MPFRDLLDERSRTAVLNGGDGARRVLRESDDGDIANLPELGSIYPYAFDPYPGDSSSSLVIGNLFLRSMKKHYPEDDHPHYECTYKSDAEEQEIIQPGSGKQERFNFHSEMMQLGDKDKSGLTWATSSGRIPFNVGKVIIRGDYTVTFTTSDIQTDCYDHVKDMGKVLSTNDRWLFSGMSYDQGKDTSGNNSYRVTRMYSYKAWSHGNTSNHYGWLFIFNPRTGDGEKTDPLLYQTVSEFPDNMPP